MKIPNYWCRIYNVMMVISFLLLLQGQIIEGGEQLHWRLGTRLVRLSQERRITLPRDASLEQRDLTETKPQTRHSKGGRTMFHVNRLPNLWIFHVHRPSILCPMIHVHQPSILWIVHLHNPRIRVTLNLASTSNQEALPKGFRGKTVWCMHNQ